jgi:propionyl-CoA carboxylase alpha chain
LAAVAHRIHLDRSARITGQLPGHELSIKPESVVITGDGQGHFERVPVSVVPDNGGFNVALGGARYHIEFDTPLREVVIHGRIDGAPFCAQIERIGLAYRVIHNGAQVDAKVVSPLAAEMHALMPFKAPPDLSRFLLSPMPGLLVDVTVKPGQKVLAGEKLAVIEAMKMENILTATQDGTVGELMARKGESLAVDQPILSFQ